MQNLHMWKALKPIILRIKIKSIYSKDEVHRHHEDQAHYLLEDEQVTMQDIDLNIATWAGQQTPHEGNVS
jgi:hypothetical protein